MFHDVVTRIDELRALMGEPSEVALKKDIGVLDEHCRAFIAHSPFMLLATAGATIISTASACPFVAARKAVSISLGSLASRMSRY